MWQCTNCGKELPDRAIQQLVKDEHGATVPVGSDCVKRVREAGTDGLFSEHSGVFLYTQDAWAYNEQEEGEVDEAPFERRGDR